MLNCGVNSAPIIVVVVVVVVFLGRMPFRLENGILDDEVNVIHATSYLTEHRIAILPRQHTVIMRYTHLGRGDQYLHRVFEHLTRRQHFRATSFLLQIAERAADQADQLHHFRAKGGKRLHKLGKVHYTLQTLGGCGCLLALERQQLLDDNNVDQQQDAGDGGQQGARGQSNGRMIHQRLTQTVHQARQHLRRHTQLFDRFAFN